MITPIGNGNITATELATTSKYVKESSETVSDGSQFLFPGISSSECFQVLATIN